MALAACELKKERSAESICRLCFTEHEQYRLIFADEFSSLNEWIGNLTSLKIEQVPGAPGSLCLECENTLKKFESFREMCFTNDRVFNEMFTLNDTRNDHSDPAVLNTLPDVSEVIIGQNENQEANILDAVIEYPDIPIAVASNLNSEQNDLVVDEAQNIEFNSNGVSEDGDELKQCTICSKLVKNLKRHQQIHTTDKPHVCNWCDKSFKRSHELKVHTRSHTQERPFKCKACDKSFSIYSNLVRHERTLTGCKPFACSICQERFTQLIQLTNHKRFHLIEIDEISRSSAKSHQAAFESFCVTEPIQIRYAKKNL